MKGINRAPHTKKDGVNYGFLSLQELAMNAVLFSKAFGAVFVSNRFGFLIETKCVPTILLSEREQFGHRTFGLA